MRSDFLYQLRSHRRHFVKLVLCLCLFLCVYLLEINLNFILTGIYSNVSQGIPCQFANFIKFLSRILRHFSHFPPRCCQVSFISVLSTAAVSRYPGGCRLSVHWSCCHRWGHKNECLLSSQNRICRCTISKVNAVFRGFRKIAKNFYFLRHICPSVCLPVFCLPVLPPTQNNSTSTGRIFIKFCIWIFFKSLSRKFQTD